MENSSCFETPKEHKVQNRLQLQGMNKAYSRKETPGNPEE
eukprot:CAMPEP_0197626152 /NCGR_PEP_ID=MMETSP1338-20131121/5256_1 /TAXON_ID=43686 ORGANISM="Pelagodinium beii, Strain RCC1491" /NCGR_SAMPLE_ID=MMETSP1338 /ASSEMBLY_ACC=CAM_ASM_000754 /LENGTH=39 /DNA_ID= /DNA_START= /DNA_END= /DNA_ORIENTATION=